jgi:hypothetical protein
MSKPKRSRAIAVPSGPEEWVVGRVSLPMYVAEPAPFRPDMLFCASAAGVIGATAVLPETGDEEAAAQILAFAREPMVGAPRTPQRIRVASPSLRDALAKRFGAAVAISLAATPEIDELAARFVADMPSLPKGDDEETRGRSYLSGGRIDPALMRGLFEAAARLYRTAPWTIVPRDTDLLTVDIPSLGAAGLCVSVIGQMRESFGIVAFASRAEFDRFVALAEHGKMSPGERGARTLGLSFDRLDDLPPRMREEIAAHGFPLAGPEAAPVLIRTDPDNVPRPLVEDDVVLGRIVAAGVARFFELHRAWPKPGADPIVERLVLEDVPDRPEVVITVAPRPAPLRITRRRVASPAPASRELRGVRATTDTAVRRVCNEWGREFLRRFRDEVQDGMEEIRAVVGLEVMPEELGDTMGSLPLTWPALWRPMRDGRTGLQAARSWRKLSAPVLAAAIERLEAARGVYAEVVSRTASGRLVLRDFFDGVLYRIDVPEQVRRQLTRWSRLFGVLVDLGDGSWTFPSVLQRVPDAVALSPAELVAAARRALEQIGVDPDEIDASAPHAGIARWAGVVAAALTQIEPQEPEEAPKRRYLVNGDGERLELHEAELALSKAARARLVTALSRADRVAQMGRASFAWIGPPSPAAPMGESLGSIDLVSKPLLVTNSAARYARHLATIAELAGEAPRVVSLKHVKPWEGRDDIAEHEGPDTERAVVAVGLAPATGHGPDVTGYLLASMRRSLDETVPELGGVPRALVATEAGRAAVEAWLREAELRGAPPRAGGETFIDLDPLRAELGLPTVAGELSNVL